jgi:hypothetical protein
MNASDALATIAEIAIAIAGFSGVAAVLGRRSQGEWSPLDVFRLRELLLSSISIVVLCFVPIVLSLSPLTPSLVWVLSSGVWAATLVFVTATQSSHGLRAARGGAEPVEPRMIVFMSLIAVAIFLFHGTNILIFRAGWPYVAAAVCSLLVPFFYFVRLLRTILRADADAA